MQAARRVLPFSVSSPSRSPGVYSGLKLSRHGWSSGTSRSDTSLALVHRIRRASLVAHPATTFLRRRGFTNGRPCLSSDSNPLGSPTKTLKDPSHSSLYYHLVETPTHLKARTPAPEVYALSFLDGSISSPDSIAATCLGWLPAFAEADVGPEGGSGLNDFVESPAFRPILHETIKQHVLEDDIWTNGARQVQEGWMHIFDQRNPPPLGRIPEPDDIIATVLVSNSMILPETFQPMPSYRLCTADGLCSLTDVLMEKLKERLQEVARNS